MFEINTILFLLVVYTVRIGLTQKFDVENDNYSSIGNAEASSWNGSMITNGTSELGSVNNITEVNQENGTFQNSTEATTPRYLKTSAPVSSSLLSRTPESNTSSVSTQDFWTPIPTTVVPSTPYAGSAYTVNESMTDLENSIDANNLTCGKSAVCRTKIVNSEQFVPRSCYDCGECYCDDRCSDFGDCCVDTAKNISKLSGKWRCLKRLSMDFIKMKYESALMIQSCPASADSEDVRRCLGANRTSREEIIPVTDMSTNTTYGNHFCARCNGVKDVAFWKLNVQCEPAVIDLNESKDQIWLDVLESEFCLISDEPPAGVEARSCRTAEVSSCNTLSSNNSVSQRLCQPGYGPPIDVNGTVYLNVFCAICNGIEIDRNCYVQTRLDVTHTFVFSLKVLLDFNVEPLNSVDESVLESKCKKDNETYDPITGNCSEVHCAPRWDYSDGSCIPLFSTAYGLGFQLDLIVMTLRGLNDTEIMVAEGEFEKMFKKSLEETFEISIFKGYYRKMHGNSSPRQLRSSDDNLFFGFYASFQLITFSSNSQAEVEQSLRTLENTFHEVSVANETLRLNVASVVYCPDHLANLARTGTLEAEINYVQNPDYDCPFHVCTVDYLPLFKALNCSFIQVNLSSTAHEYDADNSSLVINNKTLQLRPSVHLYCNQVIQICVDFLPNIKDQLQPLSIGDHSVMAIISFVCIMLSLVSLFITFVIFCFISKLRTLPGKNTMALMFHLFCAQILFQTGINATVNVKICLAMAILIHYFWLTSFAWMAVSAYHMWSTFANISVLRPRGNHAKKLAKCMAVCHATALICVLTYLGYRLGISGGRHTGYGGPVCFLVEPMDIGIFFAAPVGIILLFNLLCFLMTARAIRAVPDMKSASNQHNKHHTDVYFRLSALLGFSWVFGFIAAGLKSDILWFVFVILNGLQGMFISLAYCGTRRTAKLIRDRLCQSSMFSLMSKTHSSSLHDVFDNKHQKKSKRKNVQLENIRSLHDQSLERNWVDPPQSSLSFNGGKSAAECNSGSKLTKDTNELPMKLPITDREYRHENQNGTKNGDSNSGNSMTESTYF